MAVEYKEVPHEVLSIANELINKYHQQLKECKIGFVFQSEASFSGGKVVLGTTSKVTEKIKPMLSEELDILIVLAEDEYSQLSSERRRALIDHELCHIVLNPNTSAWTTRGHDVNEFNEIIERYGLWSNDLMFVGPTIARAVQLSFSERKPEAKGKVVSLDETTLLNLPI